MVGPNGKHLRTIENERIGFLMPLGISEEELLAKYKAYHELTEQKKIIDLPDYNGDGYSEFATDVSRSRQI